MKRFMLITLLLLLMLVPTGNVLAQDSTPDLPYYCQFDYVLQELIFRLDNVSTLEDLGPVAEFVITTVVMCVEPAVQMILDEVMGTADEPALPPATFDPNDGVMTAEEAEFVVRTVFAGDLATANLYLCPEEQILEEDFDPALLEGLTIHSVECTEGNGTITCDFSATLAIPGSEPAELDESTTFTVEDGKLCETQD